MTRQELLNDSSNKQILNQVIKQQLTGFVIEYNTEVGGQRAPGEGWPGQLCTRGDLSSLSFQNKDLIYELQILNHMLLFASKSSRSFGLIMQHYKLASKEFQNKVCGRRRSFPVPSARLADYKLSRKDLHMHSYADFLICILMPLMIHR